MKKKQSRRRIPQLRVPVLPAEDIEIKSRASNCGLPVAAYLRGLGLGYHPKGILDNKAVGDLVKVNGDLGRLGGLLKMWLTNDDRTKIAGTEQALPQIHKLLADIEVTQALLLETAKRV